MNLNKLTAKLKENLNKIAELCSRVKGLFEKKRLSENLTADSTAPHKAPEGEPRSSGLLHSFVPNVRGLRLNKLLPGSKFLVSLENRFFQHIPEKKRRPLLFCVGGVAVLLLILLISIPVTLSGRPRQAASFRAAGGFTIPFDEFFIPPEPDFLPEFILERQPRGFWTLEDIGPYWRIPENTELWRDQIRSAVDRLMEGVP